ncbi:MAG: four helix bundle protein [Calditrichaeota bacterium]|nr:four helix bundle protein [Calditrichota bacterium]
MNSKKVESFRDLVVWQKSHDLTREIYKTTVKFPKREHNSLAKQLRESATSIPINIALGFKKRGRNAKVHYYRTALSTIEEVRYYLILSDDLGHYKNVEGILEECDIIEKMLKRLIRANVSS